MGDLPKVKEVRCNVVGFKLNLLTPKPLEFFKHMEAVFHI